MESFNVALIFSFLACLVILVAKARFIRRILKANTDVNVFNHSIALCFILSGETLTFSFAKSHIRQEAEFLEDVFYAGLGGLVCIPITIWLMNPDIGEKTFNKTAALGDDAADDAGNPGDDAGNDATKTDRFLPCWILFLVRTKTIFQLHFFLLRR